MQRRTVTLLGPAFVAALAYVDPGNVAANLSAGATYGYLLVWALVLACLMAMLVQYLSAKLGVVTGQSLSALVRDRLNARSHWRLWRTAYGAQAVVVAIANRLGVHPALVCLKWAIQRGQVPIPFSIHRKNYLANLKCATENLLTDEEMKAMAGIDKKCRLIKGQVFLWPTATDWNDLWDESGVIAGA